jgi:hypothetical protein
MYLKSCDPLRIGTRNLEPEAAISTGAVEPGVLGLVIALNGVDGVSTMASCHGHGRTAALFSRAVIESTPYVLFRAPTELAQKLAKLIAGPKRDGRLYYGWHLGGYFHPSDSELVWFIEPDDVRIANQFDTQSKHQWDRARIDVDLNLLADIVNSVTT